MDMRIPPRKNNMMLESNPLKSTIYLREIGRSYKDVLNAFSEAQSYRVDVSYIYVMCYNMLSYTIYVFIYIYIYTHTHLYIYIYI